MDLNEMVIFLSRSLSYSVIFISIFMKIPQMTALYSAGSSRGVSPRAYWMEIVCYQIGIAYGYYYDYHISTYGESILLALQSYIIVAMAIRYSKDWTLENGAWFVGNGLFIAATVTKAIPPQFLSLLLASTIPLVIASRGTQIYSLYSLKTQGDVSLAMFVLATYGCAARLFTVATEIKDTQIFLTFLLSLTLNMIVVFQCLYYGNGTTTTTQQPKKKTN